MHPIAALASLGAILAWGSAAIFDKLAVGHFKSPWSAMVLRATFAWVFVVSGASVAGAVRGAFSVPRVAFLAMAASGLLGGFLGTLLYYVAVRFEEVSRVVPVTATYPVVAFILGALFLRESVTVPKVAGLVLIVAGLALVTSSRGS
ncbi:MAG: DMT family transporter [Armatimonadetes bacterium]|nr:DMT family transporter [Armatimonadota bacterium]